MNEAKEEWMPEIYCLGASLYAYTRAWRGWRNEDGKIEPVLKKRKATIQNGERAGDRWEDLIERLKEEGGKRSKLQSLSILALYLPFVRCVIARGLAACDRKLVKSGGQRVELSVALSVAGFIRSEGEIYVGPSVIYRFRWHTRYRYTDIDTSWVRGRRSAVVPPVFSSLPLSFTLFYLHIVCLALLDLFLSFFLYLSGETWFTWGHLRGGSGKHDIFDRESETPRPPEWLYCVGISSSRRTNAKKSRNSNGNIQPRRYLSVKAVAF